MGATEQVFPATPAPIGGGKVFATPFQFLFTGEDKLRIVVMNSAPGVVVQFDARFLNAGDKTPQAMAPTFKPTSDRMPNTFDFSIGVGYLLNCSLIVVSGSPLIGQTYCMVQLVRGSTGATLVLGCLLGGYITAMQHLAYPGSPIQSSIEGGGYPRTIVGTMPAAGAEVNEVVPAGARWRVRSFYDELDTSAQLGNRVARLAHNSSGVVSVFPLMFLIQPSSFTRIAWFPGCNNANTGGTATDAQVPIPIDYPLLAGAAIQTSTINLATMDQWKTPTYVVDEWLEAA